MLELVGEDDYTVKGGKNTSGLRLVSEEKQPTSSHSNVFSQGPEQLSSEELPVQVTSSKSDRYENVTATQDSSTLIPAVKSHVLRKPRSGGSRANLYGGGANASWSAFKRRAESLLLDGEDPSNNSAIFDLTELNNGESHHDKEWENNEYDSSQKLLQGDENLDQDLKELLKPPPPLESLSRMGRGMSHQKRKSTKAGKNRNKSLDQIKNVKVGRKGGTAAKIREIDVVKFICMRESLIARLKAVTRAMRATAKKIRFSRIKKDDVPDPKLVLKLI